MIPPPAWKECTAVNKAIRQCTLLSFKKDPAAARQDKQVVGMKKVLVFRHVPHEGLGIIESFLKRFNIAIACCDLSRTSPIPKNSDDYDFVISMGGPMNVNKTNGVTL